MAETSVFELTRMTHEEIEQYEDALVDILIHPPNSTSQHLNMHWQLASSELLDKLVGQYQTLSGLYADADRNRVAEWEALGRQRDDTEDGQFSEFYTRLEKLQEYYRRYPEQAVALQTSATPSILTRGEDLMADMTMMDRDFSGEEMDGRFLDLYEQYEMYINLKGVTRIGYMDYLERLDQMCGTSSDIPMATKRGDAYHTYLTSLRQYLSSFLHKTRPLEDMDAIEIQAAEFFESNWDRGAVPGWETKDAALFGDKSLAGANAEGIWCEACQRSYAKQTVYDAHLSSARHKKMSELSRRGELRTAQPKQVDTALEQAKRLVKAKALARDEVLIKALASALTSVRDDTRSNIERKAALTDRERQEEIDAVAAEYEEALATGGMGYERAIENAARETGTSEKMVNPLRLPMGWDGKPIPYWMYKLHGLSVEYKCEICSDHVYRGRKVFEKHFQEARHTFGMRALGLPNSVQFRDVTKIQDAFACTCMPLTQCTKSSSSNKNWNTSTRTTPRRSKTRMATYVFSLTQAYTRKTYELLKRQGLL